jgi:prepilin-type N-terminal cleavage/methylation domain-containing protein
MAQARAGKDLPRSSDATGRVSLNGRDQQGFSLIELIVIIGIIAILAVVAIPNFTDWRNNQNLKAAARDVVSQLQFARVEAARRDTNVTCRITPGGMGVGKCTVFLDNGQGSGGVAADGIRNGQEPILREMTLPPNITLSWRNLAVYRFTSRGFPVVSGGEVWPPKMDLTNGKRFYTVTLQAAGAVQLSGPNTGPI